MDNNSLSHTTWNCKYHIAFAPKPKYRRKIIYGELKQDIANILSMLCKRKEVHIVEAEICPDYVHMLVEIPSKMSVSDFMGYLKSKSTLMIEQAIHNKNILEQRKKLIERKERSHRLVVKGAEFEKAFPMSKDLEQEDFQKVMNEMKVLKYNRDTVRERYLESGRKERQQIAEEVKKIEKGDDS